MINSTWARNIISAIVQHFNTSSGSTYMYLPGHPLDKRDDNSSWFELRVLGPDIRETSRNSYEIVVEVDCLIQANLRDNIYGFYNLSGSVASWFTCINVTDDDDVALCTLKLDAGGTGDGLIITPFGIQDNQQHQFGTVVGVYRAYIDA